MDGLKRLLFLVSAVVFVDTMFFAALTPLLPHYAHVHHLGKAGAGVLQAAFAVGAFAGAIPSAMVTARLGVKATVVAGMLALAVTSTAFGFAETSWQLELGRFLQGIADSFAWTGALSWLVAAAAPSRRGQLIGSAFGVAIGGALFGPVLGGVASRLGTRATFSAVALLAVALAVWAARTAAARPEQPQSVRRLAGALRDRRMVVAAWLVALPALLFGTLSTLGPLRLSHLGFSSLAIGGTWLVGAGVEGATNPLIGRVIDRRGVRGPFRAALLASMAVLVLLPWPGNRWLLAPLIVVAACSFGFFWTPALSLLTNESERQGLDYAWGFAVMNLAWAPGQAIGSAAGGAIAGATADAVVYLSLAGACALTLAAVWRSRSSS